jgi:uncharacterized protein YbcI
MMMHGVVNILASLMNELLGIRNMMINTKIVHAVVIVYLLRTSNGARYFRWPENV